MILRGTFAHTPRLGSLEILQDYIIGSSSKHYDFLALFSQFIQAVNDDGFITYLAPGDAPESSQVIKSESPSIITIPPGHFILPTFCDLHLHAPQFLYQGTGLDLPLMLWLDKYALMAEARIDEDPMLARRVYTRLSSRLKENGTGTVLLFGTIKEETNLILAECMQTAGVRAFVGKLSMDNDVTSSDSNPTYIEKSAPASLNAARSFINRCHESVAHLPEARRLVQPVLTPRFVPTCTDELLAGLADISRTQNTKIQSHMAEAKDQVEWVRSERGLEDIDVFDKNNLLTAKTVQAHCTFLNPPDLSRLSARGTAVAHCPLSNAYFSAKSFPLREALDTGVKVGLGTDVAGGYSVDIMNSMRHAVVTSRIREGDKNMNPDNTKGNARSLSIDWKESLFLATRGGALALGLQGMFAVGLPFDAQEILLYDRSTCLGIGPLDYFELDPWFADQPLNAEVIEKWWCIGDVRNRGSVWVQGK